MMWVNELTTLLSSRESINQLITWIWEVTQQLKLHLSACHSLSGSKCLIKALKKNHPQSNILETLVNFQTSRNSLTSWIRKLMMQVLLLKDSSVSKMLNQKMRESLLNERQYSLCTPTSKTIRAWLKRLSDNSRKSGSSKKYTGKLGLTLRSKSLIKSLKGEIICAMIQLNR